MNQEFKRFHETTLASRLQQQDVAEIARVAADIGSLGFILSDDGSRVSYYPENGGLRVAGDAGADTMVELSFANWAGIVNDVETAPALIYGDRLGPGCRGDLGRFMLWEPLLRSLYTGMPLFPTEGQLALQDSAGAELDPERHFDLLADPPQAMREYLELAGYLLLRSVFSMEEIARFRAAGEELRARARADDKASWWGKDAAGNEVVTRVLNGGSHPDLRTLSTDARIAAMHKLMPPGLKGENPEDTDAITVLFKTPEMVQGLSDLPWHRDCGMGGHAVMCPVINMSIYLEDATPASGELRFLPGSHRYACPTPDAKAGISVPAKAGDVTLHYGDVMHGAPAPTSRSGPFRASVLMSFKPEFENHRGERHYNDVLLKDGDGHVSSVPGTRIPDAG